MRLPRTRGHELRRDHGFFRAAFFQFFLLPLALPFAPPVLPAVSERDHKREARRRPKCNRRERERRSQVKRDRQHRRAHDIRAGNIKVTNQNVAQDAPGQSFDRNRALPAQAPRQNRQQRGHKHQQPDSPQRLRHRSLHRPRAEPPRPQHRHQNGQQKCPHSQALQDEVGKIGPENPDPVPRRVRLGQDGGAVQRGIERRIRRQRKEEEERGDAQQHPSQLVQTPVLGRRKNPGKICHGSATAMPIRSGPVRSN